MILRYAVYAYLVLLPIGHLFVLPVSGAMATLSDVFLAIVILAGVAEVYRMRRHYRSRKKDDPPPFPAYRTFHIAALLLLAFSAWVALGALWSFHPGYAITKAVAFTALSLGVLAIFWCGAEWGEVADAWLAGTALCLILTWIAILVPWDALQARVLYHGGSIQGLPVPRVSGPFLHPNMFGDYLVVSGAILWARWSPIRRVYGAWVTAGAWLLAVTLVLTVSSAWVGAGVLLGVIGLLTMRQRDGYLSFHRKRPAPVIFLILGVALFSMTFAGLLLPMGFDIGGITIVGSGIRPDIWASAWEAVLESPLAGVGASPYLARAVDPLDLSATAAYWDAHNVYLSILGQFGVVGFALIAGAVGILVRALVREATTRCHAALVVALVAVGIHGITVASEEFRHLWALLGLVALAGVPDWAQGRWWRAGEEVTKA